MSIFLDDDILLWCLYSSLVHGCDHGSNSEKFAIKIWKKFLGRFEHWIREDPAKKKYSTSAGGAECRPIFIEPGSLFLDEKNITAKSLIYLSSLMYCLIHEFFAGLTSFSGISAKTHGLLVCGFHNVSGIRCPGCMLLVCCWLSYWF